MDGFLFALIRNTAGFCQLLLDASWHFALHRSLAQRACKLLPHTKIFNFYGPTEATIGVSHWMANGGNYEGVSTLPIGPPMANTHLYVLDADLQQVPVGTNTCQGFFEPCMKAVLSPDTPTVHTQ